MTDPATQVIAIIASELADKHPTHVAPEITTESTFDGLCIDWIDRTCIAVALSEAFGREFGDDEIEGWASVADVVASVENLNV